MSWIPPNRLKPASLRVFTSKLAHKSLLSLLAIALTLIGFYPYIRSILNGHTQPHVFSWVIWSLTTTLVFFGQLAAHAGVGAWPTGVAGVLSMGICILAYRKKGDLHISKIDWLFLGIALSTIPLWAITSDPLWTVVTLTAADIVGFLPTIRKSYHSPFNENMTMYALLFLSNIVAILALESISVTTVIFPMAMSVAIGIFIPLVMIRRYYPTPHPGPTNTLLPPEI